VLSIAAVSESPAVLKEPARRRLRPAALPERFDVTRPPLLRYKGSNSHCA
jgi:hypothetical protein